MIFFRRLSCSLLLSLVAGVAVLFLPAAASAQLKTASTGLQAVSESTGLPNTDPRVLAARIINVSLGIIGTIMVAYMVYAGFLWMTSGGDEEGVKKAKTMIRNAIIGLIIVLSSWAIATFVINKLLQANGGGGGGVSSSGGGGFGGGLGGGGGSIGFQLRSISPSGSVPLRNVEVRFILTRAVDPASASTTVQILRASDKTPVEGLAFVERDIIRFTPAAACPLPNSDRRCFEGDTEFIARIGGSLRSVSGETIACGGFAPPCEGRFKTGNLVDTADPTAAIVSPIDGQSVRANGLLKTITRTNDDSGVAFVQTFGDGALVGLDTPTSTTRDFDANVDWDMSGITTGTHRLISRVFDIDSNSAYSRTVDVAVLPEHCFNQQQDENMGEVGIDCGGDCRACSGAQCSKALDCATGICKAGRCIEQPIIMDVSPREGATGTFVTIQGLNFGYHPGKVVFGGGMQATAPEACAERSIKTWSSTQVIVAVPDGAIDGPIQLTNVDSNLSDSTNDDKGFSGNFSMTSTTRPGLCAADPLHGQVGTQMSLLGAGLGTTPDRVLFENRDISSFLSWDNQKVRLNVPVVSPADYAVKVRINNLDSNAVAFHVDEKEPQGTPVLDSVDPATGPVGEYVTLLGRNFSEGVGLVRFRDRDGNEGPADVSFPQACSKNFWHDTNIVVKVPKEVTGGLGKVAVASDKGPYQIYVVRQDQAKSNQLGFTVTADSPKPGICSLEPSVGPVGTQVIISGERFGSLSDVVTFNSSVGKAGLEATIDQASAGTIKTHVPVGAVSGPIKVSVAKQNSNGVNFTVRNCNEDAAICEKGQICCKVGGQCVKDGNTCPKTNLVRGEYAWRSSTGEIPLNPAVVEDCTIPPNQQEQPPSPSPWLGRTGGNLACVNAELVVRFNTSLDANSLAPNNLIVRQCLAGGANPCSDAKDVVGKWNLFTVTTSSLDYLVFHPQGNVWQASSTYEVILRTGIRSRSGIPMIEDAVRCGKGNGYCFRFGTRDTTAPCKVGFVFLTPNPFTASGLNQSIPYRANALSADDACIQLNSAAMNWRWYTGSSADPADIDGRASISQNNPDPPGHNMATGTSLAETGDAPVKINAEVAEAAAATSTRAIARLYIRLVPPKVVSYGPTCDQACANTALWAEFNVAMDPARATLQNITIQPCTNENCRSFDAPVDLSRSTIALFVHPGSPVNGPLTYLSLLPKCFNNQGQPADCFDQGRFYKVTLKGGVGGFLSQNGGLPLTGLNEVNGFSWTFRVKQGADAHCRAARVDVTPLQKMETVVGARQLFHAQPFGAPDACNPTGQPLVSDQSYTWDSLDKKVAILYKNGLKDTTAKLPPHCSDHCLDTGADGVVGQVASCGNGLVETTDSQYCHDSNNPKMPCKVGDSKNCVTRFGDACFLLSSNSKGGEECDPGINNGHKNLCGNTCLWKPATSILVGGTCGNGIIEAGEQCDSGALACVSGRVGQVCKQAADCTVVGVCDQNTKLCTAGQEGRVCQQNKDCDLVGACAVKETRGCSTTCQALGAQSSGSVCGNKNLGDGETCDDGNTQNGDGCSVNCLHEGSTVVSAVCGNGKLEPGEMCESCPNGVLKRDPSNPRGPGFCMPTGKSWPQPTWCDPTTCLNVGVNKMCAGVGPAYIQCCGNGKALELGKDCDNGLGGNVQGSGCTPTCLSEGSSAKYRTPSFCGDGLFDQGEQCEAVSQGDGLIDEDQLAQITAFRSPNQDKDGDDSSMVSVIQATYDGKDGQAKYGLQCGFTSETPPPAIVPPPFNPSSYGLTDSGCYAPRPVLTPTYPPANATGVCRNILISGMFNVPMDPGSFQDQVLLAAEYSKGCPAGTEPLTPIKGASLGNGWRGFVAFLWQRVKSLVSGSAANAAPWCVGAVPGIVSVVADGNSSRLDFALTELLAPNTKYRLFVRGDPNLGDQIKQGVKSALGVVGRADAIGVDGGTLSWSFTTGKSVCSADVIQVQDLSAQHPYLFTKDNETHPYEAKVYTVEDSKLAPLSSIPNIYSWQWDPWVSAHKDVLVTVDGNNVSAVSHADATALNKDGSSLLAAQLHIIDDKIFTPSTTGRVLQSGKNGTVLLCERPWPSLALAPFMDAAGSQSLQASSTLFAQGPFYNFSTTYCMDAGSASTTADDLPSLEIHPVPLTTLDVNRGIARQYLFTYSEPRLRGDAIGMRIVLNPLHLSPASWYAAQGFKGSPQSIGVDGYEAIQDGTTVYVAAANVDSALSGNATSTIYLLSRNPDAKPETQLIFNQMLKQMSFNVNLQQDSQNVCVYAGKKGGHSPGEYFVANKDTVHCTADWECLNYDTALKCASLKAKLQRDTKRVADFQELSRTLDTVRDRDGKYPTLSSGSFLQTISTSRWPSWQITFGANLGGSAPPQDPINKYLSCGFCSQTNSIACTADADCPKGETCAAQNGFDPATCWNAISRRYQCPTVTDQQSNTVSVSRVYQYRSVDAGKRYELATELEAIPAARYSPSLITEVKRCSNTGFLCKTHDPKKLTDVECDVSPDGGKTIVSQGTCNGTGGSWIYQNYCNNTPLGIDDVCGNGVRGLNEACETNETRPASCKTADGKEGTKIQTCGDCKGFIDGPSTSCVADSTCGNGRVDRYKCYLKSGPPGHKYGQPCLNVGDPQECVDPTDDKLTKMVCDTVNNHAGKEKEEVCDDGALNGTYGHCLRDCSGQGPYCGDGQLSLGETCDNGPATVDPLNPGNGQYACDNVAGQCNVAGSCSLDCRGLGPYCGDGTVQAPEQCDGNSEQTTKGICLGGSNAEQPCDKDADCSGGGTCGGGGKPEYKTCVGVSLQRCSNDSEQQCKTNTDCDVAAACDMGKHICLTGKVGQKCQAADECAKFSCITYTTHRSRDCVKPGKANQCSWRPWSVCVPDGSCGDGKVDPGEDCDLGANNGPNSSCTFQCKKNVCGDGQLYAPKNGGPEECDYGSAFNTGACLAAADYASTCIGCSPTCHVVAASGGYCGDAIRNGPEQCDQNDIPKTTCKQLGFDYSGQASCDQFPAYCLDPQNNLIAVYKDCDPNFDTKGLICGSSSGLYRICKIDSLKVNRGQCLSFIGTDCKILNGLKGAGQAFLGQKNQLVDSSMAATCQNYIGNTDVITCTQQCDLTGCKRCQDDPGNGQISGQVFDAVYSNQPVPGARVTLYLRGIRITDTLTAADGKYSFKILNTRPECSYYRIIIDFNKDNPCTGNPDSGPGHLNCNGETWPQGLVVDEGQYGGYWPYESDIFGASNFQDGTIFLAPRVGPNETLVIVTWKGSLAKRYLDAHLVVPPAMSYKLDGNIVKPKDPWVACDPTKEVCKRDVYWSNAQGWSNLDEIPHAHLYCFQPGSPDESCAGFDVAPETLRYKRGDWGLTKYYSFYLVDFFSGTAPPSYQVYNNFGVVVRVITQERIYKIQNPAPPAKKCGGKYWLVFQQDAGSGAIIENGSGQSLCGGEYMPLETPNILPGTNKASPVEAAYPDDADRDLPK